MDEAGFLLVTLPKIGRYKLDDNLHPQIALRAVRSGIHAYAVQPPLG